MELLLRPAFWLPVAVVVPLCVPWYWITRHMLQSTGEHPTSAFNYIETAVRFYVAHSFRIFGVALLGLAVLGFIVQVILKRRHEVRTKWAVLAALVISIGFLSCVVPVLPIGEQRQVMGTEERFLFPAIAAIIAFGFAGTEHIVRRLGSNRLNVNAGRIVLTLIVAATLVPRVLSREGSCIVWFFSSREESASATRTEKGGCAGFLGRHRRRNVHLAGCDGGETSRTLSGTCIEGSL